MSSIKEELIEELNDVKTVRDLIFFIDGNCSYFEKHELANIIIELINNSNIARIKKELEKII